MLESCSIPLRDAAKWSIARAARSRPRSLLIPITRRAGLHANNTKATLRIIVILICATTAVLQFSSTILLADLTIGPLAGLQAQRNVFYNLLYPTLFTSYVDPSGWIVEVFDFDNWPLSTRLPTWRRNPAAYPTFAEYRRPAGSAAEDDIDDTGTLLRAFLPFSGASLRETLRNYTGKSLVLDSRVSCQAPDLSSLSYTEILETGTYSDHNQSVLSPSFTFAQINGSVSPSKRNVDRLWAPPGAIPFSCVAGLGENTHSVCQLQTAWKFSDLCGYP